MRTVWLQVRGTGRETRAGLAAAFPVCPSGSNCSLEHQKPVKHRHGSNIVTYL